MLMEQALIMLIMHIQQVALAIILIIHTINLGTINIRSIIIIQAAQPATQTDANNYYGYSGYHSATGYQSSTEYQTTATTASLPPTTSSATTNTTTSAYEDKKQSASYHAVPPPDSYDNEVGK